MHTFTLDDERNLVVEPRGMIGWFGMLQGLGLGRMPVASQGAACERAEWVDLLAKLRGMTFAETLYRFPVVRQACGCRVLAVVDPVKLDQVEWLNAPPPPRMIGRLATLLCTSHPHADLDGTVYTAISWAWIVDRSPESHGERRG